MKPAPLDFDEFFLTGLEPTVSPFLTDSSKKWCRNLGLKNTIFSAVLLIFAFFLSSLNIYLSFLLLTVIYFLVGIPSLLSAWQNFKRLDVNINFLMTLSAFIALGIGRPQEGALLLVLFGLSNAMERALSFKTKSAIHHLNKIAPTKAFLIEKDGSIHEKSIKEINVGDSILIKAGEIIPVDGIVMEGASSINLEHLTGEAQPVFIKKGNNVPAGSHNIEGSFTLKVQKTSHESTLNQIILLISEAQKTKPKIERIFDSFSRIYASLIILLALFSGLLMPFIFSIPYFGMEGSIYRSLAFLIAASPCALIIAIPAAYLSGISVCAKKGIILKGGTVFDSLYGSEQIAFDKTGTLTKGKLSFVDIKEITPNSHKLDPLSIAATLEKGSTHPIAEAIISSYKKNYFLPMKDFKSIPGYGAEAKIKVNDKYKEAFIGLSDFIEKKLTLKAKELLNEEKKRAFEKGQIITVLYVDGEIFLFKFFDSIRKNMKEIIRELKKQNLKLSMLTGDNLPAAKAIAKEVEIDDIYADLRPGDKLKLVTHLAEKSKLVMIGDGINDAPALMRSSVGISMGKVGSATAVEASDVILITDDLSLLPWLFNKTKALRRIVLQNLFLALAVIAFASIPALLGYIPLWLAVTLHEGGTFLVGLNSLRLLKK